MPERKATQHTEKYPYFEWLVISVFLIILAFVVYLIKPSVEPQNEFNSPTFEFAKKPKNNVTKTPEENIENIPEKSVEKPPQDKTQSTSQQVARIVKDADTVIIEPSPVKKTEENIAEPVPAKEVEVSITEPAPVKEPEDNMTKSAPNITIPVTVTTPPKTYYVTISEDTLWEISETNYGSPFFWPIIYCHNINKLPDPDTIEVGVNLELPKFGNIIENLSAEEKSIISKNYYQVYLIYKKLEKPDADNYLSISKFFLDFN